MTESDPDPHQSTAAIILATGQSGRMQSQRATVLHALAGRPMAVYPAQSARKAGCSPLVAACTADTVQLQDFLGPAATCALPTDVNRLEAAVAAIPDTRSSILVVSGAMPLLSHETMSRLIQCRQETSAPVVLLSNPHPDPTFGGCGIIRDSAGRVRCVLADEDPSIGNAPLEIVSTGVACVARAWLWEHRSAVQAQDEDFVASLLALAIAEGIPVETVCLSGAEVELLQIRDRADLALAESTLRKRIRARAMRGGVTLVDPATTWIDDTVTFGQDITVLPNCHLYGDSAVGDNCTIGPGTRLQDTRLAANVTAMESVLEGAEVSENVRIGPFAHLRPGTVIGRDVEIGNYAELKNTRVSPGAKMHHVGYLGDTVVGNNVNIGAGAITCNYDGAVKHETEIGDGAFVGSGTLLVAPLRVGSNAMTGAGSVVTRDVPPSMKAYGVPARVRGVRALPAEDEQQLPDEKRGA